jgi:hypothetical protein
MYANLTAKNLSMVFVSLDQEEAAFDEYRKKMRWPAVPFRDARRALLQIGLGIKSIPALVLIDSVGKVLTSSGVTELMNDPDLERFPYGTGAVDLSVGTNVEKLQRSASIIAFADECSSELKTAARQVMNDLAAENNVPLRMPRAPRSDILFSIIDEPGKLNDALRMLCGLPSAARNVLQLVIIDLANEKHVSVSLPLSGDDGSSEALQASIRSGVTQLLSRYTDYTVRMEEMVKLPPPAEEEETLADDLEVPSPEDGINSSP